MDQARQREEVERNDRAFEEMLAAILPRHRDQFALMRAGEVIGYFDKPGDAFRTGLAYFSDGIFSIQEVTEEPIWLGAWAYEG